MMPLPSWGSRTRRNNPSVGLVIRVMAGPSGHAISPHRSSREGHHSTPRWSSGHVRFGSKADICTAPAHVRFTPIATSIASFHLEAFQTLPDPAPSPPPDVATGSDTTHHVE